MPPEAISVRGLRKSYRRGPEVLQDLDLEVVEGQVFGLVGPDGAGKTTLLKVLAGVLSFSGGEVRVLGQPLPRGIDEVRCHIGYLPQRFSLYGDMTVRENLDFYAELFPSTGDLEARKLRLLDVIGLADFQGRLAANLSGGMKQKLALLCSLVHEPRLLLMDEPTVGVDPVSRREFWGLVFELQRGGLTVFAATPYMDEAEQFDRIVLLHEGRILREGTPLEVRASVPGLVLEVACERPFEAARLLEGLPGVEDVQLFGDRLHLFVPSDSDALLAAVKGRLAEASLALHRVRSGGHSIEDVFLRLTA